MDLIFLLLLFAVLVVLMVRRLPLFIALGVTVVLGFLVYRVPLQNIFEILKAGIISRTTLLLILSFYAITFLQRMMEKRDHLKLAEESLTNLFGSRRINAMVAPFIIGLLPAVGAVLMARPIVDQAAADDLNAEERCFVTSFYRHISESFLPTYPSIILAIELSGVPLPRFVLAMLPLVLLLFILGFIFYIRKIPKTAGFKATNRRKSWQNLIISLWGIVSAIILILAFQWPVYLALAPILVLSIFVNRFSWKELRPMFISAFEWKLVLTLLSIMVFKELLVFTGVVDSLAAFFGSIALPPIVIFGLLFFFGTILTGAQAMIAMMLPVAVTTLGQNLGVLVFIMSMTFIASQVSPSHICLGVITESYGLPFTSLVKKTVTVMLSFILLSALYSYVLSVVF
ncbi:MAG TPA: DUF401 family protein [Fastidiosipila sp.]|nr:DUF401 family protein [Fastidiosipila sp.]